MTLKGRSFNIASAVVSFIYFLSLFPFLQIGYGVEEDSWGLVLNAQEMFTSMTYSASRLPGHPLHEYLLYLLYPATPLKYNFISAIFGSFSLFFCAHFFKKIELPFPLLSSIALCYCPVVFISGTYTIDYTMSLAFIMTALYFLSIQKIVFASIFLAFATGTRISNLSLLLPFIFFIGFNKHYPKKIFSIVTITVTLSILFYIPVIQKYGFNFFDYSDQFPYPNFPKFFYKLTIGVFGLLGTFSLGLLFYKSKIRSYKAPPYAVLAIVLSLLIYIRLPQKSAYLIPMIPFIFIIFSKIMDSYVYKTFCILILLSGWCLGISLVDEKRGSIAVSKKAMTVEGQKITLTPFQGNIILDLQKRKIKQRYTLEILNKTDTLSQPSVIISGWWYNQLCVEAEKRKMNSKTKFVFFCSRDSLVALKNLGCRIYFLEEQDIYNDLMFQDSCTNLFSKSF